MVVFVVPPSGGFANMETAWIPACAGMTCDKVMKK